MEINPMLLKGSERLQCTECNCIFFTQTFIFQKISKFKVGSPQDVIVPIPVHRCSECGSPIQDELDSITEMVKSEKVDSNVKNLKSNSSIILS